MKSLPNTFGGQLFALLIGTVSGALAWTTGMPLPWLLGAMVGVTAAALAGAPVEAPARLRLAVVPVIGVMLGSSMKPDLFSELAHWTSTLVMLPPFLAAAATISYVFYRRVGGYDPVTAFFSAMPGGLNDMLLMGAARGGNERKIALAHATRVLVAITFVVLTFGFLFGVRSGGGGARSVALADPSLRDWAILGAAAVLGALLGKRLELPAAPIFGPMLLSGAAHMTEIVTIAPPGKLVVVAQIVIGTVIGCRFRGATLREIGRDVSLGAVSALLMIAMAISFAAAVFAVTGTPVSQVFLAFSPGGLTEMSLLAFAMDQDPAYVSVMHLLRIFVVIFAAVPIFGLVQRLRPR